MSQETLHIYKVEQKNPFYRERWDATTFYVRSSEEQPVESDTYRIISHKEIPLKILYRYYYGVYSLSKEGTQAYYTVRELAIVSEGKTYVTSNKKRIDKKAIDKIDFSHSINSHDFSMYSFSPDKKEEFLAEAKVRLESYFHMVESLVEKSRAAIASETHTEKRVLFTDSRLD